MASILSCLAFLVILRTTLVGEAGRISRDTNDILAYDNDDINTQDAFDAVMSFSEASKKFGSAGSVAGQLVMNIESGVKGTISKSDFDGDSDVLKLHVVHSKSNEGEIATPSKVPILWKLDEETTYTLQKDGDNIKLFLQGVEHHPFDEGIEMYKKSGVKEACATKKDLVAKVQCERAKLFKYFAKEWKTFKKNEYLSEPSHKIGRIMKAMYGGPQYAAIQMSGGKEAWEKMLYAFVTIPPKRLDYFFLLPDSSGNEDDVEIALVAHEITDGEYAKLIGISKHEAEADPVGFEKDRKRAESFARSSFNFAAMGTKGRLIDKNLGDIKGGTAQYILKFASPCNPKKNEYKYNDASDYCRGDYGRVYWH